MSFDIMRDADSINREDYVIVTYDLASVQTVMNAAWDLAIGQSVGNPNVRNNWETETLFENHAAIILRKPGEDFTVRQAFVDIGFPVANVDWNGDGISQLLCTIMGGQTDINHIVKCRVVDIEIPDSVRKYFLEPKVGIKGIREYTKQYDKPLLGGIIKPKTGLTPDQLLDMVKQLVDGGVDFIKEDEIMSNPAFCQLEQRVDIIEDYLSNSNRNVVYCYTINGDPHVLAQRAHTVAAAGGNGIHINIWSGLGAYNSIRKLDLPLWIHYQKSGDKVITHPGNAFGISWVVLCKLAALAGVDSIHAGMYGGYLSDDPDELKTVLNILTGANVLPALSCGMHPGLVRSVTKAVGHEYMANVGGALHGHPGGTKEGTIAMRQAIDGDTGPEYEAAIEKWGLENV